VLKDCERKQNSKDSKYESLADAISERVRDAVGETHWARARQIQKQLALNQQKKRWRDMKAQHDQFLLKQKQRLSNASEDNEVEDLKKAPDSESLQDAGAGEGSLTGMDDENHFSQPRDDAASAVRDASGSLPFRKRHLYSSPPPL
jgi:hypothetical protein